MMVYDSTALQLTLQAKPLCYLLAELELSSVSNSKLSYRRDRLEIAPKISIDAELDPSFDAMSVSGSELRKSHVTARMQRGSTLDRHRARPRGAGRGRDA